MVRGTVAKRSRTASCGMARSSACGLRAARRSASVVTALLQVSATWLLTCERAVTTPPDPRRGRRPPSASALKLTGPRFAARIRRRSPRRRLADSSSALTGRSWRRAATMALEEASGRDPQQLQDPVREDTEEQDSDHREHEPQVAGPRADDGRRLGFWVTHVHGDDDADGVERGEGRVEGNDHRQPAEPGVDGRDQDGQLGEEADRWRD